VRAVFERRGERLLTIGGDGAARLWDVRAVGGNSTEMRLSSGFSSFAQYLGGRRALCFGERHEPALWDTQTGRQLFPNGHLQSFPETVGQLLPDGRRIAFLKRDALQIVDLETGLPTSPSLRTQAPL